MSTPTENENGKFGAGFQMRKHVERTKWESFKRAIYNPTTKEFCGRTSGSWGRLLLFYAIFYAVLAAMFAICMSGLLAVLTDNEPRWKLDKSLIGTNPGLGFRPISSKSEEGSLIWYNIKNQTSIEKWSDLIDDFLKPYNANQTGKNFVYCDFKKYPEKGEVCQINISSFGECNKAASPYYGFDRGSPCIFLKLNKIFDWEPDFFTEPQADMPKDLNITIRGKSELDRAQIWVTCRGENSYDRENVEVFSYNPQGFPGYYYPYKNYPNYLSPLVAVQILQPKRNVIINIECRAWAKNINYIGGSLKREGSVHFELLIEDPPVIDSTTTTTTTSLPPTTAT